MNPHPVHGDRVIAWFNHIDHPVAGLAYRDDLGDLCVAGHLIRTSGGRTSHRVTRLVVDPPMVDSEPGRPYVLVDVGGSLWAALDLYEAEALLDDLHRAIDIARIDPDDAAEADADAELTDHIRGK